VVYLLALASAAVYGAADFLGGLASRRTSTFAVVVVSQFTGLVLLAVLLPMFPDATPSTRDVLWGGAAGLTGGIGVALLYRALAVGTMALVAPTTAVCAVAIPVLGAMMLGERPASRTVAGILIALVAIVLVSQQRTPHDDDRRAARSGVLPPGIGLALTSGVAIGLFFLSMAQTSPSSGMWPLVSARVVSVTLFGALALVGARPLRMAAPALKLVVAAGALDMLAGRGHRVCADGRGADCRQRGVRCRAIRRVPAGGECRRPPGREDGRPPRALRVGRLR
jgi:uncharacterized membrane protein